MLRPVFALLLMLLAPGLAEAQSMSMKHAKPSAAATASDRAYAAAMDTMMAGMTAKPTGDPDRDFVTMMLPHHAGAVDMAQVELKYGKDPALLKMAKDIVDSQTREIGAMRDWQTAYAR